MSCYNFVEVCEAQKVKESYKTADFSKIDTNPVNNDNVSLFCMKGFVEIESNPTIELLEKIERLGVMVTNEYIDDNRNNSCWDKTWQDKTGCDNPVDAVKFFENRTDTINIRTEIEKEDEYNCIERDGCVCYRCCGYWFPREFVKIIVDKKYHG